MGMSFSYRMPKDKKERIVENFNIFDFELSADDMASVATLDTKQSRFFDHRDPRMVKILGGANRNTCDSRRRG
jgi:diketogulonate reductase-like aldo/keto reductase